MVGSVPRLIGTSAEPGGHAGSGRAGLWRARLQLAGRLWRTPWISVKPTNARHYLVYHVVGWRLRGGGTSVVIERDIPDRLWYDAMPEILDLRGPGVDDVIAKIDAAARAYPYGGAYSVWPGPNSNTFIAWIARRVTELSSTCRRPPSVRTGSAATGRLQERQAVLGFQFSLFGLAGVLVGAEEGLEVNVAGLNFGLDPLDLAVRLPGIGRIGFATGKETRRLDLESESK